MSVGHLSSLHRYHKWSEDNNGDVNGGYYEEQEEHDKVTQQEVKP